jgi:hypothetical protein
MVYVCVCVCVCLCVGGRSGGNHNNNNGADIYVMRACAHRARKGKRDDTRITHVQCSNGAVCSNAGVARSDEDVTGAVCSSRDDKTQKRSKKHDECAASTTQDL